MTMVDDPCFVGIHLHYKRSPSAKRFGGKAQHTVAKLLWKALRGQAEIEWTVANSSKEGWFARESTVKAWNWQCMQSQSVYKKTASYYMSDCRYSRCVDCRKNKVDCPVGSQEIGQGVSQWRNEMTKNASTSHDSFFMFFQHTAAAKNFDDFFWYWRVGREGFLQCGGHFGPVENIFKCMHYQHYFSHTDGLSFHQYHLE